MKPKQLNLEEMWQLYLLLKPAIDGRKQEDALLDEVDKLVDLSSSQALLESIRIMYDNDIEFDNMIEFSMLFMISLHKNEFFDFIDFIRGLDGSSR